MQPQQQIMSGLVRRMLPTGLESYSWQDRCGRRLRPAFESRSDSIEINKGTKLFNCTSIVELGAWTVVVQAVGACRATKASRLVRHNADHSTLNLLLKTHSRSALDGVSHNATASD